MLHVCDIAIKPFSKWRPTAMLNFRNLVFWSRNLYPNMIVLLYTKFRVKRTISRWDIARKLFSISWPSAILNLQNCDSLSLDSFWNQNLHLCTKFHWNRMILGWDRAIKTYSKWRPFVILNFWKLLFWSCGLRPSVILLLHTKFCVNRTINRGDIAKKIQYGGRPPYWIWCYVILLHPGTLFSVLNIVLNFQVHWFSSFWYTWAFIFQHFGFKLPFGGQNLTFWGI